MNLRINPLVVADLKAIRDYIAENSISDNSMITKNPKREKRAGIIVKIGTNEPKYTKNDLTHQTDFVKVDVLFLKNLPNLNKA